MNTDEYEYLIKRAVDSFLGWTLPNTFRPDGGIHFEPVGNKGTQYTYTNAPAGTNLFNASEAEAMFRACIPPEIVANRPDPFREPQEDKMTLDLTKPMRVKKNCPVCDIRGRRFWATAKPDSPGIVSGILEGESAWQSMFENNLENLPEIMRREQWVNIYSDISAFHDSRESADEAAQSTRLGNPVHLIFCHDPETGKTWVDVPKEGE